MENQIEVHKPNSIFATGEVFELAQRIGKAIAASSIIPDTYKGNLPNTLIALELANRIGASPLMVMQHLYIVHGKPSFSSTFLIASINQSGKFSPLRFTVDGIGDQFGCVAWAKELASGETLEGPRVTIQMAKDEGWYNKNGSKWKTMPELMLRYRAATFFSRLYCPEITMGMQTREEAEDISYTEVKADTPENKPVLEPGTTAFDRAKKHIENGGSVADIQEQFIIDIDTLAALTAKDEPSPVIEQEPEPQVTPELFTESVTVRGRNWKEATK